MNLDSEKRVRIFLGPIVFYSQIIAMIVTSPVNDLKLSFMSYDAPANEETIQTDNKLNEKSYKDIFK